MLPAFRFPFRTRSAIASDVDEELRFHFDAVAARLRAEGWSPAEAEAEARRRFGDIEFTRSYCRSQDLRREQEKTRMTLLQELTQDVRYGLRGLRAAPAFTLVALATLAFGIGANTAIFSVVRGVLLEPLPFAEASRIVRVWNSNPSAGIAEGSFSEPDLTDISAESRLATSIGGFVFADGQTGIDLTGLGTPERLSAALVTPGFFETLRPRLALGRLLAPSEYEPGRNRVVVLSHALWQRRFGGDSTIVGKSIILNGEPFSVVGVMSAGTTYPAAQKLDVWMPLSYFGPDQIGRGRAKHFLSVIARLEPGVTAEQLRAEVARLSSRLSSSYSDNPGWNGAIVRSLRESITGEVRRPLLVLAAAVAIVLLITCVNIASLLLARATARQRELSLRAALGAGRGRIVRQLLTESLTLSVLGGILGAILSHVAVRLLVAHGAAHLPGGQNLRIDAVGVVFTIALSLAVGLLFGGVPATRAAGPLEENLQSGARAAGGSARAQSLRSIMVVSQVALAMVLVAGAGLASKSFSRLLAVDPGFRPENVLVATMSIPDTYSDSGREGWYYERVLEAIRNVPGVSAAGSIRDLPTRGTGEMLRAEQLGLSVSNSSDGSAMQLHHVSAGFFKTMGTPVKEGRDFEPTDRRGAPVVFVVNEAFVRRFSPGESAIGKMLHVGKSEIQIVGVVGDIRHRGLSEAAEPAVYVNALQNMRAGMSIVVRTHGDPMLFANAVRNAIWSVDRNQPISEITTMENVLGAAVARQKLLAGLLTLFGAIGLLLGALGIYGLLSFAVTQRRQEIGVRAALGAPASSVMRLIVGRGMLLASIGAVVGMLGAWALTRQMQAELFGITSTDPATFAQVTVVLLGAALFASWLPARRALSINPVVAMRYE
jgi:predicted permease